ncbi:MAG: SCO family protein [Gammaproteobacteria bacterium]|nr:SCO family protein [Gammaproteobacteria bacterium]
MAGFAELLPAQEPLAPGYNELSYELPEPGSYQLPPFGTAADGEVLSEDGKTLSLHQLFDDKYTLLSFIYSNCSDINGCPLSAYVFYQIKSAMQKDARLAKKLQLISLSFDPARDTPPVMRLYGNNFKYAGARGDWHFLTTGSEGELEPILKAYDQDLQRYYSVEDDTRLEYAHILRVFLIDPEKRIRNIYSVGFLHADLVLRDIQTLFLEESAKPGSTLEVTERLAQPGDYKHGYDDTSYQSRSRALTARLGETMDLLNNTINPPLGLPPLPASMTDGLSVEKIELGKKLFFDRRLSHNETFSCAMCHIPEQGFTNNELAKAVGIEGRTVRRNSPTIYNVAYYKKFFHDGREDSLTQQIWGPLLAHNEMGNPSVGAVIGKIKSLPDYEGAFEEIYQGKSVSMETLGDAMAAYQISLLSADSPFDRWYFGKQQDAISDKAKAGFSLFTGKAACASCHLIADDHALFTDQQLHNTGSGYRESMGTGSKTQRVNLAPGVFVDVEREIIDSVSEKPPSDLGLYEITQDPRDRWKYKTPSLRNIAHTAPYMHNGAFGTLEEVVEFYNHGGVANEDLDPRIKPLGLNREEVSSLVEFLQTLDGDNIDALVSDAFTAPVSDCQWIDR